MKGLAALFAYRMGRMLPITFTIAVNDYGFELLSPDIAPIEDALAGPLFTRDGLLEDIPASLNASEMARRQFREIARVSGIVFQGYPGAQKTTKQVQASSGLLYDVFAKYDPGNLLMRQAHREVFERQLEQSRLGDTLEAFRRGPVTLIETPRLTPFAFPLVIEGFRDSMTSETLADRVQKMQVALEKAANEPERRKKKAQA